MPFTHLALYMYVGFIWLSCLFSLLICPITSVCTLLRPTCLVSSINSNPSFPHGTKKSLNHNRYYTSPDSFFWVQWSQRTSFCLTSSICLFCPLLPWRAYLSRWLITSWLAQDYLSFIYHSQLWSLRLQSSCSQSRPQVWRESHSCLGWTVQVSDSASFHFISQLSWCQVPFSVTFVADFCRKCPNSILFHFMFANILPTSLHWSIFTGRWRHHVSFQRSCPIHHPSCGSVVLRCLSSLCLQKPIFAASPHLCKSNYFFLTLVAFMESESFTMAASMATYYISSFFPLFLLNLLLLCPPDLLTSFSPHLSLPFPPSKKKNFLYSITCPLRQIHIFVWGLTLSWHQVAACYLFPCESRSKWKHWLQ